MPTGTASKELYETVISPDAGRAITFPQCLDTPKPERVSNPISSPGAIGIDLLPLMACAFASRQGRLENDGGTRANSNHRCKSQVKGQAQ